MDGGSDPMDAAVAGPSRRRSARVACLHPPDPSQPPLSRPRDDPSDDSDTGSIPAGPRRHAPHTAAAKVVIIDNIVANGFSSRKEVEQELFRVAPWLSVSRLSFLRRGGLRVQCTSVEDAARLTARTGWPADAFHQDSSVPHSLVRVHLPGKSDPADTRPPAASGVADRVRHRRSVMTSAIRREYSNAEVLTHLSTQHVLAVRTVGDSDPRRNPLRAIEFGDDIQAEAAIREGLRFLNVILRPRRCHARGTPIRCHRCQAVEQHSTFDCPAPQPVCARCSGPHHARHCPPDSAVCCARCGSTDHSAAFLSCPKAQEAKAAAKDSRLMGVTAPSTTPSTTPTVGAGTALPVSTRPNGNPWHRPQTVPPEVVLQAVSLSVAQAMAPIISALNRLETFLSRVESRLVSPPTP